MFKTISLTLLLVLFIQLSKSADITNNRSQNHINIDRLSLSTSNNNYEELLRNGFFFIQNDSIKEGLILLGKGIERINNTEQTIRISEYIQLEFIYLTKLIDNGSFSQIEEKLIIATLKEIILNENNNTERKLTKLIKKDEDNKQLLRVFDHLPKIYV